MKWVHHGKSIRSDLGVSLDDHIWHIWLGRFSVMWVHDHYVRSRLDGTHSAD
jgi:hypothetical protein